MKVRTIEERYNFLLKYLQVSDIDVWEGDAILRMKPLFIQFSEHETTIGTDMELAIDRAMDVVDWDIAYESSKTQ